MQGGMAKMFWKMQVAPRMDPLQLEEAMKKPYQQPKLNQILFSNSVPTIQILFTESLPSS